MKCPNSESSSSPTGFSSDTGACAVRLIDSTSRPTFEVLRDLERRRLAAALGAQLALVRRILFSFSTTWTGMRIVRPLSASARATAWRIHHVAYVENLKPLR